MTTKIKTTKKTKRTTKTRLTMKARLTKPRHVLVGNKSYGLYIGTTTATDESIVANASVRLDACRHVCAWYGKTGGITSLAAFGPCGPRKAESRVGAPCSALLTGVVNVLDLTDEAVAAFASIVAT